MFQKYRLLLFGLISFVALISFRYISDIDALKNATSNFYKEARKEKVYLHLDRQYFSPGEDIWMKAYVVQHPDNKPSEISKLLYVDLVDVNGKIIDSKKVRINKGEGFADIRLPMSLRTGKVKLLAYTNWMRNFGADQVFQQELDIYDPYTSQMIIGYNFQTLSEAGTLKYSTPLKISDQNLAALANKSFKFKVTDNANLTYRDGEFKTDSEGFAHLEFVVASVDSNKPLYLNIVLSSEGGQSFENTIKLPLPTEWLDLQFYPEGGRLLAGKISRIAFQGILPDYSSFNFKGVIKENDQEILSFNALHEGMGSFEFTPKANTEYTAEVELRPGLKKSFLLPKVHSKGLNLSLKSKTEKGLDMEVNHIGVQTGAFHILVQANGKVLHSQSSTLSNGITEISIPASQLSTGIHRITLFDEDLVPQSERLVFYFPEESQVSLAVKPITIGKNPREKVELEISSSDHTGLPLAGSFSVSVTDPDLIDFNTQSRSNILSHFLIESELKGTISNPGFYFGDSPLASEALDLLTLIHGWQGFDWEIIKSNQNFEPKFPAEKGIYATGQVKRLANKKKAANGGSLKAFYYDPIGGNDNIVVYFGDDGKFELDEMQNSDTTILFLQAYDTKLRTEVFIEMDPPSKRPEFIALPNPPGRESLVSESKLQFLKDASRRISNTISMRGDMDEILLQEIIIQEKKPGLVQEIERTWGAPDRTIVIEDSPHNHTAFTIWDLIQGRIAGVQVYSNRSNETSVNIRNSQYSTFQKGGGTPGASSGTGIEPIYVLDGVQTTKETMQTINPMDVIAIDVYKSDATAAAFGSGAAGGVIAVYSKKGGADMVSMKGTLKTVLEGYSVYRRFYSPNYADPKIDKSIADQRATLHWEPEFKTKANAPTKLSFYRSDLNERFQITIQGWTSDGKLAYYSGILE
jgi:hypothetical protein